MDDFNAESQQGYRSAQMARALSQQALNRAIVEAVEFVHAEGWDQPPTLFALVPAFVLAEATGCTEFGNFGDDPTAESPLTLIVQENLPDNLQAGSPELGDYISRVVWPQGVVGAVLAQEIRFAEEVTDGSVAEARPARLVSGALLGDLTQTVLQLRPTEEELAEWGPFGEDRVELRGGAALAPEVAAALAYSLTNSNDEDDWVEVEDL